MKWILTSLTLILASSAFANEKVIAVQQTQIQVLKNQVELLTRQVSGANAKLICYSGLKSADSHSIIPIPLPNNDTDLDAECHRVINHTWHAGGIVKGTHHTQNCETGLDNLKYGSGYTSYVTEASFEGSRATYSACNASNAYICCSQEFPN